MVTCPDLQTAFLFCFSENWPLWCYCYSHANVATFSILIPIQQCGSHDNEEVTLAVWLLASPSLSALLSFIKQGKWESSHLSSTWGVVSQWGLSFRREEAPQETLRSLSPSGGLGLISHHLLVQRSPPRPHLLSCPTQSTEAKVRGTGGPWRWTCHVQPQLTASEGIWGTVGRWGYPACSPICMWRELVSFPNKGISSQVIEDTKRTSQYLRDLVRNRGLILRTEKKTK